MTQNYIFASMSVYQQIQNVVNCSTLNGNILAEFVFASTLTQVLVSYADKNLRFHVNSILCPRGFSNSGESMAKSTVSTVIFSYNITFECPGNATFVSTELLAEINKKIADGTFTVDLDTTSSLNGMSALANAVASTAAQSSNTVKILTVNTLKPTNRPTLQPVIVVSEASLSGLSSATTIIIIAVVGGFSCIMLLIVYGMWKYTTKLSDTMTNMFGESARNVNAPMGDANVDYNNIYGANGLDAGLQTTSLRSLQMVDIVSQRNLALLNISGQSSPMSQYGIGMGAYTPTGASSPVGGTSSGRVLAPEPNGAVELSHIYRSEKKGDDVNDSNPTLQQADVLSNIANVQIEAKKFSSRGVLDNKKRSVSGQRGELQGGVYAVKNKLASYQSPSAKSSNNDVDAATADF